MKIINRLVSNKIKSERNLLIPVESKVTSFIDKIHSKKDTEHNEVYLEAMGWAIVKDVPTDRRTVEVILKGIEKTYSVGSFIHQRNEISAHFGSSLYDLSGFYCLAIVSQLEPGEYDVHIRFNRDEVDEISGILKSFKINGPTHEIGTVISVHIPKTAGRSFLNILEQSFGHVYEDYDFFGKHHHVGVQKKTVKTNQSRLFTAWLPLHSRPCSDLQVLWKIKIQICNLDPGPS